MKRTVAPIRSHPREPHLALAGSSRSCLLLVGMAVTLAVAACGSGGGESGLVQVSALNGSRLDLGLSGRGQALLFPPGLLFLGRADRCLPLRGERHCELSGAATAGEPFGVPVPLTDPQVPICFVASFERSVTGTVNRDSGCAVFEAPLQWNAFLKPPSDSFPCPLCVGDQIADDDRKDGVCSGGERTGEPCDAASTLVGSAQTSLDCPPLASRLVASWSASFILTTGSLGLLTRDVCSSDKVERTGNCLCDQGSFPTRCEPRAVDYRCSKEPSLGCPPGSGSAQCEFMNPGSGSCVARPRPCLSRAIFDLSGHCDGTSPTLVGFSCVPPTESNSLNILLGTPGPALLKLKALLLFR